jgi:hypothetical protein
MGALNSLAAIGLNAALGRQAQQSQDKELRQEQNRQLREIQLRDAEERRLQEQTLRRRMAEERARAGAAGVGSTGGSADAIVRGLVEESRLADATRAQQVGLRTQAIRDAYRSRRSQNLLDFAGRLLSLGQTGASRSRSLLD